MEWQREDGMNDLPQDIKPDWLNVIRRLQSIGRQQAGYGIVTIQVIVDANGIPVLWNEPELKRLEPQTRVAEMIMKIMSGSNS